MNGKKRESEHERNWECRNSFEKVERDEVEVEDDEWKVVPKVQISLSRSDRGEKMKLR